MHWLAGNVPLLGILVLVQSLITKNVNILKTAANNMDTLRRILATFADRSYTTPAGYTINGNDMLRTFGLVYYPHTATNLAVVGVRPWMPCVHYHPALNALTWCSVLKRPSWLLHGKPFRMKKCSPS